MVVTMHKRIILAAVLSLATFGLQACFYDSGPSQPYGRYQSSRTLCDEHGNNCVVCDANNNNCEHAQYQSSRTLCDAHGNNCMVCDANNNNCGSTAKSSWGFFF